MADFEEAGKLADKGLAMCYELGDKAGIADALLAPGFLPDEGALSRAHVEESLALFQGLNDSAGMSHALYDLAQLALDQGSPSQARMFAEQSLALYRERGDRWGAAFPIGLLGYLLLLDGRCSAARGLFEEC